jgi:hypothetical protein
MELTHTKAARNQSKYDELKTLSISGLGCANEQPAQDGEPQQPT